MGAFTFGFAGTPAFAARVLFGLLLQGLRPSLVLTGPDRRQGRGRKPAPSAVKRLCLAQGINLRTPANQVQATAMISGQSLDAVVVAAYGLLLPKAFLEAPRHGCINVHASLLPRWRGAAPIERALMAGDEETGVSIMQVDAGLDTGPIIAQAKVPIGPESTAASLGKAIADLGVQLLCDILPRLGEVAAKPQEGKASYAHKLSPEDAWVDWHQPASELGRKVRALVERMPAAAELGGVRVQLLAATPVRVPKGAKPGAILAADRGQILVACGQDALQLTAIKLDRGKGRVLGPADALNGFGGLFRQGNRFRAIIGGPAQRQEQ